jgi:hypothetical protein
MGSNMFGPKDRRDKPEWKGWWGDTPPYHAPVLCSPIRSENRLRWKVEQPSVL